MSTIKSFEDILAWQKARELSRIIGSYIDEGRFKKNFSLLDQIERSSGSIMDNIAEGFERGTKGEFITFLGYAKGSCGELRSQLYRSMDRKFILQEEFNMLQELALQISGLLQNFISYLQKTEIQGIRKKSEVKNIKL